MGTEDSNVNNIPPGSECLFLTIELGKIIIHNLKYIEPNICKISGVELLCLLYKVAKELEFNIHINSDLSFKYYTKRNNPKVKGKFDLANYYILLHLFSFKTPIFLLIIKLIKTI